jgi:hypothetical protein
VFFPVFPDAKIIPLTPKKILGGRSEIPGDARSEDSFFLFRGKNRRAILRCAQNDNIKLRD